MAVATPSTPLAPNQVARGSSSSSSSSSSNSGIRNGGGRLTRLAAAALAAAALVAAATARSVYVLHIPGRFQFDPQNGGYSGEVALQQIMLAHGVWIPQQYARDLGGGRLAPETNYARVLGALKIKYSTFPGSGGYKAFAAWAKKQLMPPIGAAVLTVAYVKGENGTLYDRVLAMIGIDTASQPTSYVYRSDDIFYVNTGNSTNAVKRTAGDYSCNARKKKDTLANGGCVPTDTKLGISVAGPAYAGIGPRVQLLMRDSAEPGRPGGPGQTVTADLVLEDLIDRGTYNVYKVTNRERVPASPTDKGALAGAELLATVVGSEFIPLYELEVSFQSNAPVWFICVRR